MSGSWSWFLCRAPRSETIWSEPLEARKLLSASIQQYLTPVRAFSDLLLDLPTQRQKPHHAKKKAIKGKAVTPPSTAPFTETLDQIQQHPPLAAQGIQLPFEGDDGEGDDHPVRNIGGTLSGGPSISPSAAGIAAPGFAGTSLADQMSHFGAGWVPPDTMGAIGIDHFVELINSTVAIYTRGGTLVSLVQSSSFFNITVNGTTYPRGGVSDPRILFDQRSGHFFALAMEVGDPEGVANNVILAVSRTTDPTGAWDKYLLPVGLPTSGSITYFTDYPTLGLDDNGVYVGMHIFPSSGSDYAKIVATPKAPLIAASPSLGPVFQFSNITDLSSSPQPAYNMDPASPTTHAWFVSSSYNLFGNGSGIAYRSLSWNNGAPTLSATLNINASFDPPIDAPALGSTTSINVGDGRLQMALIRNGRLWTTRTVQVNASGGTNRANRDAVEWLNMSVGSSNLSSLQSGRIYDSAASDPEFYYYPSLAMNGQGNVILGFSGSKSSQFVSAFVAGTSGGVTPIKTGAQSYNRLDDDTPARNRWGDYSFTSVDPRDDQTLWTIQEYAASQADIWGTWVDPVFSAAPTLNPISASGQTGQNGVTLNLTGTGLWDPGAAFPNRLAVKLGDGISDYQVSFNSATSVTLKFDIAPDALPGTRDIVLTNPDGQTATLGGAFTVLATPSAEPDEPQLLATDDTGISDTDGLTKLNNASPATVLHFTVAGTIPGATVTLLADGIPIGSAQAADTSTIVTTDGATPVPDGIRSITAIQTEPGKGASEPSDPLAITIDTAGPIPTFANISSPRQAALDQASLSFSEPVVGLAAGDFSLDRDGFAMSLSPVLSTGDGINWIISGLADSTSLPGTYTLTLSATAPITDQAGNPLTFSATAPWMNNAIIRTDDADNIRLVASPSDATLADVYLNPSDLIPAYQFRPGPLEDLVIRLQGGDDQLTLDFSNGAPIPATVDLDASGGTDVLTMVGSISDDAATLDDGQLTFNGSAIRFDGIDGLQINAGEGDDELAILSPPTFSPQFNGGAGHDLLEIDSGAMEFDTDLGLASDHLTLRLRNQAQVLLGSDQNLEGLDLQDQSTLDVVNHNLILAYSGDSPEALIQQYAKAGRLIASDAGNPLVSLFPRTLAVWDNGETRFGSFDGVLLPDFNQVLVKYTYFGDANLDGLVTPKDYAIVDGNVSPGTDWARGDLNGDASTTPADYAQIDGNIGAGSGGVGGPQLAI